MSRMNSKDAKLFKKWTKRLEVASKARRKAGEESWLSNIELFNNRGWSMPSVSDKGSTCLINMVRSTCSLIADSIYFQNPRIHVDPAGIVGSVDEVGEALVEVDKAVEVIQTVLNEMFPRLGAKDEIKRAIIDSLLSSVGWLKIYYETETISSEEEVEKISHEEFVISRIYPLNMLVDPSLETFDISKAEWIAELKFLSVKAAKEAYKDAEGRDVRLRDFKANASMLEDSANADRRKEVDDEVDRMRIWEIHDRVEGLLIEIAEGIGIIRKQKHPYYVTETSQGFIYEALGLGPDDPNSFYPRPYVESLVPINNVINRLSTFKVSHVGKSAKTVTSVAKGMYDDKDLIQITDGGDGTIVEHNPDNDNNQVFVVPQADIQKDVWNLTNYFMGPVWQQISRVDEMARGSTSKGVSPTEASYISQGTGIGMSSMRDQVEDFASGTARVLLSELQQFVSARRAVRILGPVGSRWFDWAKEDIVGDFYVNVESFSTAPYNSDRNKREIVDIYNLFYGKPEVDNVELTEAVLKRFELPTRILRRPTRQGPQDPQQEHAALINGIPLRVDPTEDHARHISEHESFLAYLQALVELNPGDENTTALIQNLAGHLDQQRLALVQIQQPQQQAQAIQGALGNPAQPAQDMAQARGMMGEETLTPGEELAGIMGGAIR